MNQTTEVEVMPPDAPEAKDLQLVVQQNHLQADTAENLQRRFAPLFGQARNALNQSRSIVVTSPDQKLEMKMARACRLELKAIRVAGEKTRKEIKEESLRTSKAIDGFAAILEHLIVTEENRLEEQEKFVELQEQRRKAALKEQREKILREMQVDPNLYQLGEMSEDTFTTLVEGTKLARAQQAETARKAEAERIEREAKEAAERERIRLENERLKKEAEERAAKEKLDRERRHDLHCTRMAIMGAESLLDEAEITEADAVDAYGTQSEPDFEKILHRFRVRSEERKRLEAERVEAARKLKEAEDRAEAERERLRVERETAEKKRREIEAENARVLAEQKRIAEEAAATERKRVEAEKAAAAEKAKAERAAAEAKAKKEREAREKAEAELKAQRDAEAAKKAAEEEARRKAAAAPDKDRLLTYANAIRALEIPELKTAPALQTLIQQQRDKFVQWLETSTDKI